MSAKVRVEFDVNFTRGRRGRKRATAGCTEPKQTTPSGRVPRVTKLMALAIRFEQVIRDGEIAGYSEIARLGGVTRARMTQIMGFVQLCPAIQQEILTLPRVESGRDPISERDLRPILAVLDWAKQLRMWHKLRATCG